MVNTDFLQDKRVQYLLTAADRKKSKFYLSL